MHDRRTFLKNAAAGTLLAGTQLRSPLISLFAQEPAAAKTKVYVAHGASSASETQVLALLDKAMLTASSRHNLVDAWRFLGFPHIAKNRIIGLKVNCSSGRATATHTALVMAVCERLQGAGVSPGNIVIWDRYTHNLEACGFKINTDHNRIRCFGSDRSGYEKHEDAWESLHVRLSKILTQECALILNMPILQAHDRAGLSFAMMNLTDGAENIDIFNSNSNPAVADFSCLPALRDKTSITIGDALSTLYDAGPQLDSSRIGHPGALIIGDDRVATDTVAWQLLDRQRKSAGLPSLAAAHRAPAYLHTAADTVHNLGTDDPNRIQVVNL